MGRLDLMMELERGDEPKKEEKRRSSSKIHDDWIWNDDHVTEIYKDYDLYLSAKNGNLDDFKRFLDRVSADEILSRLSPAGNTYLHVAAKHGNEDIITFIAAKKPSLVLSKNFNGETALHLVAKAGNASMVRALVLIHQDLLVLKPFPENEGDENNLLRVKNFRGNTALHVALINGRDSIAEYLIKKDPELSYCQNNDGESALSFAARDGFANCVSLILELSTDEERVNELFKKKSPIEAAIKRKHRDVLEAIFSKKPSLIQLRDGEGRNPLHYAASLGYLDEARYLLNQYAHNATQRDKKGSLPIHLASINDHIDVVRFLLQDLPDPTELLDKQGRSILHLAARYGRSNIVNFVLKNPDLVDLINMRDKHGNTSLHLATMYWHPKIVSDLTWDKRVDIKIFNDMGMSALDAAGHFMSYNPPFTERLTWVALKAAGTPRYQSGKTTGRKKSSNPDIYKDRVNTLLLVSTLVATVTFAAGFTVPGGYNSSTDSDKNLGMATMLRDKGFHVFVFCDTMAMYTSIVVAVALIWAQLSDLALVLNALTLAVPLLGIALSMMAVAFTAGLFIVVSKLRWLATAVLIMGAAFMVILFLLLLPLCTPLTSRNRVLRYLSYYPFCLLMLVSSS